MLCFVNLPLSTMSGKTGCSTGQLLLPRHLMNGLNNLDEAYGQYSLASTDDLIRFWRSKVKVISGRRGVEGIHDNDEKSVF